MKVESMVAKNVLAKELRAIRRRERIVIRLRRAAKAIQEAKEIKRSGHVTGATVDLVPSLASIAIEIKHALAALGVDNVNDA